VDQGEPIRTQYQKPERQKQEGTSEESLTRSRRMANNQKRRVKKDTRTVPYD